MTPDDYQLWTTVGTVGAVVVALAVALTQAGATIVISVKRRQLARRNVASLVSAWVEHVYKPSAGGEYYRRTVTLHLANESDEPVFRVEVLCGIETGQGVIQTGLLSVPRIIPVLPPKREFTYDVTMGMLGFGDFAHDSFQGLIAAVGFRDHEGTRWERTFNGDLTPVKELQPAKITEAADELTIAQAGPTDNPYNRLTTVFAFVKVAADEEINDAQFHQLLIEQASGWERTKPNSIAIFREMLRSSNLALHVWYPTPRIAYTRVLEVLSVGETPKRMHIITLVWRNEKGWRLFGVGPYLPWDIPFGPGELNTDPLDGRE